MSEQKTLFVFYTFEQKGSGASWMYKSLPKGWGFVGSGSTSSLGGKVLKHELEEQFQGPKATQEKAREYLCRIKAPENSCGYHPISLHRIRIHSHPPFLYTSCIFKIYRPAFFTKEPRKSVL